MDKKDIDNIEIAANDELAYTIRVMHKLIQKNNSLLNGLNYKAWHESTLKPLVTTVSARISKARKNASIAALKLGNDSIIDDSIKTRQYKQLIAEMKADDSKDIAILQEYPGMG